jgi:hypothetical protein
MKTRVTISLIGLIAVLAAPPLASAQWITTNIAYAKRDLSPMDYYPDDTSSYYQVRGRITSPHFTTNGSEFFIQDTNDNVGIRVDSTLRPALTLYSEIDVIGKISQTAGVRRITPEFSGDITVTDPTPVPVQPVAGTLAFFLADAERYEGTYVVISNVYALTNAMFAYNASASLAVSDSTARITLRVDADMDIDGQLAPTNPFTLYAIFSQFDTSVTPTGGYQMLPRFYADIQQSATPQPPQIYVVNSNRFSVVVNSPLAVTLIAQDRNPEDALTISLGSAPTGADVQLQTQRVWRLSWTPDSSYENTTNFITVQVTDDTFTNSVVLEVTVLSETLGNIKINEIHWDPAANKLGDANHDGTPHTTQDEFVEIVNASTTDVDITGWQLCMGTNLLFTFPPTVLTGRTSAVVFGGGSPTGVFGHSIVYAAPTNWAGLANSPGANSVRLVTDGGAEVSAYNYAAFGTPDMAITRNPDYTGDFVLHTSVNSFVRWTPGTKADGKYFEGTGQTNSPPLLALTLNKSVVVGKSIAVPFQAYDPEGNPITFAISNAPPSASFTDYGNGTALLTYTGLWSDLGTIFTTRVSASDGIAPPASDTFLLTVADPTYAGLIINEVCANPSSVYDSNEDGECNSSADEFIEIVNTTTGAVNLAGCMIYDAQQLRHLFSSVVVPSGGCVVVFGGGSLSNFWASPAQLASSGALGINNSPPETMTLYDPQTNEITRFELNDVSPIGASLTRYPDLADYWTNHYDVTTNTVRGSPGRRVHSQFFYTNVPPVFASVANVAVAESNSVNVRVFARAYDGDSITLTASNLPAGATFTNTPSVGLTTGLLTWASAQPAGVYTSLFFAADKDGVATTSVVITVQGGESPPEPFAASVVINEIRNSSPDMVELLVISNNLNMQGMLIKDYSSSGAGDNGGAYVFATNALWESVRAGTLIVLRNDSNTLDAAVGGSDYNLEVGMKDPLYFVTSTGTFDIATEEIVQIKAAGSPPAGHTGAIHTIATVNVNATNYAAAPIPKLKASAGNCATSNSVIALNSTASLSDFNGTNALGSRPTGSIGTCNTNSNCVFILSLRKQDQDDDGIPDDWETLYFGCATCGVANADDDADGFSNLEEYLADTIPTGPGGAGSFFAIENLTNATARYIQFISSTARVYTLQATATPTDGNSWSNVGTETQGTGGAMTLSDTNAADRQLYRLRVRLP